MEWGSTCGVQRARDVANCPDSFATPKHLRRPFSEAGRAETVAANLTTGAARDLPGKRVEKPGLELQVPQTGTHMSKQIGRNPEQLALLFILVAAAFGQTSQVPYALGAMDPDELSRTKPSIFRIRALTHQSGMWTSETSTSLSSTKPKPENLLGASRSRTGTTSMTNATPISQWTWIPSTTSARPRRPRGGSPSFCSRGSLPGQFQPRRDRPAIHRIGHPPSFRAKDRLGHSLPSRSAHALIRPTHEHACDSLGPLHSWRRPLLRLRHGHRHLSMGWHSLCPIRHSDRTVGIRREGREDTSQETSSLTHRLLQAMYSPDPNCSPAQTAFDSSSSQMMRRSVSSSLGVFPSRHSRSAALMRV